MPEPDKSAEREKRKEALRQRLAEQAAVPEQFIVGGGHKLLPLTNYLFPIGITLFGAVLSIILLIVTCLHPQLGVQGKSFYYRKKWYACEEIWEIRITGMSRLQIFTSDRMLASFPLAANGAETFIRWANKNGVSVRDDRAETGG